MAATSNRPYLLQAMLQWIVDNKMTPHIVVRADHPQVMVPTQFINDGRIVLNINPQAIRDFVITTRVMTFRANFSGERMNLFIPLAAIEAIYAHENGQGINLDDLDPNPPATPEPGEEEPAFKIGINPAAAAKPKPHLRVLRMDRGADNESQDDAAKGVAAKDDASGDDDAK